MNRTDRHLEDDVVFRIFRAGWSAAAMARGESSEQARAGAEVAYQRYREEGRDDLPRWESRTTPLSDDRDRHARARRSGGSVRMF
jgi:hypothetical protein